jgi:hypothetical protein
MRIAFKEWAVICDALARGRQVLILRKGGLQEDEGVFRPDYDRFLLYPTFSHQALESVIPEARETMRHLLAAPPRPDQVRITHFAEVHSVFRIESIEALHALRDYHIWAEPVVEERFHRWREDMVHALIVRVYALPGPAVLRVHSSYAGCKTWVELTQDVDTQGAVPVLNDVDFDTRACAIRIAVCGPPDGGPME